MSFCGRQKFYAPSYARLAAASLLLLLSLPVMALERKTQVRVMPEYPEIARRMGISGTVRIEATVAPNGTVEKVMAQSGHGLLTGAAKAAVMQWRFVPSDNETKETVQVDFSHPE